MFGIKYIDFESQKVIFINGTEEPLSSFKLSIVQDNLVAHIKRWPKKKTDRIKAHEIMMSGKLYPDFNVDEME